MDETFLTSLLEEDFIRAVAARAAIPEQSVRRRMISHISEARTYFRTILPRLRPDDRVLEVGAGMGLVSRQLAQQGFDVTALEPCGTGFDLFQHVRAEVDSRVGYHGVRWLPIGVDQLDPAVHGRFSFIFSWHVLEHVPDVASAVSHMASVKEAGGQMVHICPNYRVPYDPHIGAFTLPFAPQLTALLYRRKITEKPEIWRSLNFVTAGSLHRICRQVGLRVEFESGAMADSFARMKHDPVFAARHNNGIIALSRLLSGVLSRLDPRWQSPMTVRMT